MSINKLERPLILHAANIHCGGGLVLLEEFLRTSNDFISWAQLDERTKSFLEVPVEVTAYHVKRSIFSRLLSEWRLWRNVSENQIVLCFHGLPPLFSLSGRTVVFVQNRILVEHGELIGYSIQTRLRLLIERFWLRAMKAHATRYIVQTPSMAASLRSLLGGGVEICVQPFSSVKTFFRIECLEKSERKFDFIYVASGDAHKNHITLLKAWRFLAECGLRPSLALTVDPLKYPTICAEILDAANECSLNICNLGQLAQNEVVGLYQSSSALVYPSLTESFGLPLVEAAHYRLPILASELDYVRDVVVPVETFDPNSPVSIARAVRRFLDRPEPVLQVLSAESFLTEVLR